MIKDLLKFSLQLLLFVGFLLLLLWFILPKFDQSLTVQVLEFYAFNGLLGASSYGLIRYLHEKNRHRTGFVFLALVLVKMALAALYIIPLLKSNPDAKTFHLIQFFLSYFLLLFFEAYALLRLLKELPPSVEDASSQ